ncbi:MAG: prolipoprotein diacylglyceryl transferase, partial [Treponema sp.]|nr:prolipoprotein diacylglyceryl transferase [Treponema sp.]
KPFDGFLAAVYTAGYAIFRFFIEYFREPDTDLGYRFAKDAGAPTYLNESLLNISTGQVFCLGMVAVSLGFIILGLVFKKKLVVAEET